MKQTVAKVSGDVLWRAEITNQTQPRSHSITVQTTVIVYCRSNPYSSTKSPNLNGNKKDDDHQTKKKKTPQPQRLNP